MKVVVLGMGGTIAGATDASEVRGYKAGQVAVSALVTGVDVPEGWEVVTEQVAQIDSKDMDEAAWLVLARRAQHWLLQDDVRGVVVTHGTDTLEETAFFLHLVLSPAKPLVLTGAMRPATDAAPDGPRNLADAIAVARMPEACGVLVVFAGRAFRGSEVRKVHPTQNDAFASGSEEALAKITGRDGVFLRYQDWPVPGRDHMPLALDLLQQRLDEGGALPWVAWVSSHAGASGDEVRALVAAGVKGVVVGGSGNASVHRHLESALDEARRAGIPVVVGSRCSLGDADSAEPGIVGIALQPAKARIALQLKLLGA